MTFGEQNTEEEAWEQLDYAVSQGVNFIDTAGGCAQPAAASAAIPAELGRAMKCPLSWRDTAPALHAIPCAEPLAQ